MKREGYVVKRLDQYLISLSNRKDTDRAIDVNAPSQMGKCMRSNYYARKQVEKDSGGMSPVGKRCVDNGTKVHERLQEYMLDAGILLMDEVPVIHDALEIQGHTDGLIPIGAGELAILEIKSIHNDNFSKLTDALEDHKVQGSTYVMALENRRASLRAKYATEKDFLSKKSVDERTAYYKDHYQHIKEGRKYTREEKIAHCVSLGLKSDAILYNTRMPITKVVFLYENKNNQELKEYMFRLSTEMSDYINNYCVTQNDFIASDIIPPREGSNKSDSKCRWCSFKIECWN